MTQDGPVTLTSLEGLHCDCPPIEVQGLEVGGLAERFFPPTA